MQLDRVRFQIRPRNHLELLDLAIAICRTHWIGLGITAAIGILPCLAFNLWFFSERFVDGEPQFAVFPYALALLIEAPWATALMTLYLGQAAFAPQISAKRIFQDWFGSLGQMLLFQGVVRGGLVVLCFTIPVIPIGMRYLNEIILLERSTIGRMYTRSSAFHNRMITRIMGEIILDAILGLLLLYVLTGAIQDVADIWNDSWSWEAQDESFASAFFERFPIFSTAGQVAVWLAIAFFAVVRFVSYLDCRIRREGWDIELKLRAQVQAMRSVEAA